LIRVILIDDNYNEYLVYEAYPLLTESNIFSISMIGEETVELNNIIPVELKFYIVDASILLKVIHTAPKSDSGKFLNTKIISEQNAEKIELINENIKRNGLKWIAGETSVSKMSYQEKKRLFGGKVPNLHGFEYYNGGIFSKSAKALTLGNLDNYQLNGDSAIVDTSMPSFLDSSTR